MSERPQVIVIGGGFGGLTAARELADEYVGITLVDRANHHLFQPLLYQVATAGLSPTDIAVPIRRVLTKQYGRMFLESLPPCTARQGPAGNLPREAGKWLGTM